jgi:hypothetical protein
VAISPGDIHKANAVEVQIAIHRVVRNSGGNSDAAETFRLVPILRQVILRSEARFTVRDCLTSRLLNLNRAQPTAVQTGEEVVRTTGLKRKRGVE